MRTCFKASLNERTVANLKELMIILNQTNYTHTINIIVSTVLENLKASNHSYVHAKKMEKSRDHQIEQ